MTGLHETLTDAVTARLELARAAQAARPGGWQAVATHDGGTPDEGQRILAEEPTSGTGFVSRMVVDIPLHPVDRHDGRHAAPVDIAAHVAANSPDVVIRHCERDLRVLNRHWRNVGACEGCWRVTSLATEAEPWPCPEIEDLATAYGIEVPA